MTARIEELLQRAEHKRRDFLLQNRRDAWRVINGPGDGAPAGLSVDKYGEYFVLNVRSSVSLKNGMIGLRPLLILHSSWRNPKDMGTESFE